MAEFEMSGTLQKKLGNKLRTQLNRLARELADDAKAKAPRDKHWVNMQDNRVRPQHRNVEPVPANLRFTLNTPLYDLFHYDVGETQMGPYPNAKDDTGVNGFTPGLWARTLEDGSIGDCRCHASIAATSMLADKIEAHLAVVEGDRIRATITCDHPKAADAEFGNSVDKGARFLGQALRETARRLGASRIASR
jgi:hypothetical protein